MLARIFALVSALAIAAPIVSAVPTVRLLPSLCSVVMSDFIPSMVARHATSVLLSAANRSRT